MSDPARPVRPRRSVLAVPGSSPRMLAKAPGLAADEVFLDLEDAVAPDAKTAARANVISALSNGGWTGKTVAVRINDPATRWAYRDVVDVVEAAGAHLDCVLLPKVRRAEQVAWLDYTLGQIEQAIGLPTGRIRIEAQIEDARGVAAVDAIAAGSPRLEALVFGPADFMASVNMRSLTVGEQPPGYDVGDAFHYVLMRILVAARAHDLLALDGPYLAIHDVDGLRRTAGRSAALGYDGKWVVHPGQIEEVNAVFSPSQQDYDRAEQILAAHQLAVSEAGGGRGAVMLGTEMIDEASRKMAAVIAAKGRAAGLTRQDG
ncbi:MAG TPA: CoA ester lyase [Actinomycetes bacterium]|nr:CoA ester lyase [Actinomycetes bacterium]